MPLKIRSPLFVLATAAYLITSCGKFTDPIETKFTSVTINRNQAGGFQSQAILNGGLIVYAVNANGSRQASSLPQESNSLTMTLPVGQYTFYAVGWPSAGLASASPPGTNLYCATSATVDLKGSSAVINLAMNQGNCISHPAFAPSSAYSSGTIANLKLTYCSPYNTIGAATAGGNCESGGATPFGSFKIKMLTYGYSASGENLSTTGEISSACIAGPGSPGATVSTNLAIPTGVQGTSASPFALQLVAYVKSGCTGTSDSYVFSNGLANGSSGNSTSLLGNGAGDLSLFLNSKSTSLFLSTSQAADGVIGQPNFTTSTSGTTQSSFNNPAGLDVSADGVIRVSDKLNNRIMGFNSIPVSAGANADFVLGQSDFFTSTSGNGPNQFFAPGTAGSGSGKLAVPDITNNRVLIYNSLPTTGNPSADLVIGAATTTGAGTGACSASTMNAMAAHFVNGKLLIADNNNDRILIYNSIPTTNGASADIILGSQTCVSSATSQTFYAPSGLWTDGKKLVVGDYGNHRVLIWNTFPTVSQQPADLVLGQPDMTSSAINAGGSPAANTIRSPISVWSNRTQLIVAETSNNRVLVWNTFPTVNQQAADVVLGQPDFSTVTSGITASKTSGPVAPVVYQNHLLLTELYNNRVLIFKSQ